MAKSKRIEEPQEEQEGKVVPLRSAGPPSTLKAKMAKDAGKGVSTSADDNLVPLVYVLQPLSPQVQKKNPKYIQGAEQGDIWLRGLTGDYEIVKGDTGILVQPCHFKKCVIEWISRDDGGGFVTRHDVDKASQVPGAVRKVNPKKPSKQRWVTADDHELIETREHVVRVFLPDGRRLPYVIPFSSTGHTASRGWMMKFNQKQVEDVGTAPSWACLYRLTTDYQENNEGQWFAWDIDDEGGEPFWVEEADYEAGAALHAAFNDGQKQAATYEARPAEDEGAAGAEDTGDDGGRP